MQRPKKILIIKTGYSEFLDRGISTTVSLGDVLFCTAILHLYENDHVTWVTSWSARELFKSNPYVKELLIFGPETMRKISSRTYDVFINLEKDIGICTFLGRIKARRRCGFYFDPAIHDIATFNQSTEYLLSGQENHKSLQKSFFEILFETVGAVWDGQGAVLARPQRSREVYDIGFNYSVGTKWPTKAWPMESWKALEKILGKDFKISWQTGHNNLHRYVDWLDRCRLIVTSDSLGQVVSHALGKKVVSLFGPTNHVRLRGVEHINIISSTLKCPHMPCYLPICQFDKFCMDYIAPKTVAAKCRELLS